MIESVWLGVWRKKFGESVRFDKKMKRLFKKKKKWERKKRKKKEGKITKC